MRCCCGQPGIIKTLRREFPYCQDCFQRHLAKLVRQEAGQQPVKLKPTQNYFFEIAKALCKLAKREIILDRQGLIPGCAETAAAATIKHRLGYTQQREQHFPKSITLEELQTFFKAELPVLDTITQELIEIEKRYPGTINSINKQ